MAGPGRPKTIQPGETLSVAPYYPKVAHARFHLGVQIEGKVYMSLDKTVHKHMNLEMFAMPTRLFIKMNGKKGPVEIMIPDSVTHSILLDTDAAEANA